MILINTEDIVDGMKLAQDLIDENGNFLLGKGHVLRKKYINALLSLGFTRIYVYLPQEKVEEDEGYEVISPENKVAALKAIRKAAEEAYRKVDINQIRLNEKEIVETIERIIAELLKKDEIIINLVDLKKYDSYTFFHSVSVTVLSLILGIKVGLSIERLKELGYGAILHDIGKLRIPREILSKIGPLSHEEMEIVKKHTLLGFEILKKQNFLPYESSLVALQHHERVNASGYPYHLNSEEIHLYSKITAIADVYDALTSDRPYRKAILPHLAVEYLMGAGDTYFDFELIRKFIKFISIYPIGTMVELNTGEIGIVTKSPPSHSFRPTVKIFFDKNKKLLPTPIERDLMEEYTIFITKVIEKSPFR